MDRFTLDTHPLLDEVTVSTGGDVDPDRPSDRPTSTRTIAVKLRDGSAATFRTDGHLDTEAMGVLEQMVAFIVNGA